MHFQKINEWYVMSFTAKLNSSDKNVDPLELNLLILLINLLDASWP